MIRIPPQTSGVGKPSLHAAHYDDAAAAEGFDTLRRLLVRQSRSLIIRLGDTSGETRGHVLRVARLMRRMCGCLGISTQSCHSLYFGALLHDIGKVYVREEVLHKVGTLDEYEWDEMRLHPILGSVVADQRGFPLETCEVILHHHERFDGKGYPKRLAGDAIPLGARIFSVIDAYDAITNKRCYRESRDERQAVQELSNNAGTQFDPQIVNAFINTCLPNWK